MAINYTKEIGVTGLDSWMGQIQEDFLRELRGVDGYRRYNEMRLNSPICGALLAAIEQSIRGVDWYYSSELGEDDPRIEFLNDALDGMSHTWQDHLIEALTMLPFGFAPFELVYKREGGRLTWRKFAIRGQDTVYRWLMDTTGGLQSMVQVGSPSYKQIEIPIEKLVLYRTRLEKGNPEGRSILRQAWIPYYYAKNIQMIEGIGIERNLAGLPVITLPEGASTGESDTNSDAYKAAKFVRNLRNDEQAGMVLPYGWELSLMASSGLSKAIDTNLVITRHESRMLMSALAQWLILGQDRVGTQALSSDQTNFWNMSVNATADIIASTHTRYAAHRLLTLNGFDIDGIRMEHTPAGDTNIGALADAFAKLGDKVTWMPTDEVWLRGAMQMPVVSAEEIEQAREVNRQRALEMRPQFAPSPFERDDEDDMSVDWLAADLAPDDDERQRWERRYERVLAGALGEQQERVMTGARRAKRG